MNSLSWMGRLAALAVATALLGACAETQFLMHTAKRLGDTNKPQGTYKIGKPYQIQGVWYHPAEDWTYNQTGIASWYGPKFHGKATANGEVFDQWAVSAAHKTLPLPSIVRVTNLENGRSLVVRVNDRGPFVGNRIIDMSHRAAQLLGFDAQGTAQVRVEIMAKESQILAQRAQGDGLQLANTEAPIQSNDFASAPVAQQELTPLEVTPDSSVSVQAVSLSEAPVTQSPVTQSPSVAPIQAVQQPLHVGELAQVPVSPTRIYIQAGAFSKKESAERVMASLKGMGDVSVTPTPFNGSELFRVRLGPIADVANADQLLAEVVRAGYPGARTVVENVVVD